MPANSRIDNFGFDKESGISPRSAAMTANDPNNPRYYGVEWRAQRDPDYHVHIYNLSARTFEDQSGRGIIGRISLRAAGVDDNSPTEVGTGKIRPDGKPEKVVDGDTRYSYVTSFPQPVLISKFNDESNQIGYVETDAIRFVVDQIHPDNPTRSLDVQIPNTVIQSSGNNYAIRGVFFSLTNPPMKVDVDAARVRMERYYNQLLEKAGALEHTNKDQLASELQSNPDYGYAAQYFGRTFTWNRKNVRTTECPNCGEQKPANRLFHTASWGLCVERSQEAWRAVIEAGVRTYDTVPEEYRWREKSATK